MMLAGDEEEDDDGGVSETWKQGVNVCVDDDDDDDDDDVYVNMNTSPVLVPTAMCRVDTHTSTRVMLMLFNDDDGVSDFDDDGMSANVIFLSDDIDTKLWRSSAQR